MTRRKMVFIALIILQIFLFTLYLNDRINRSHQSASQIIDTFQYQHELIDFPEQPQYLDNRQIWLIVEILRVSQVIDNINGRHHPCWNGLIHSFYNGQAETVKKSFWDNIKISYPEFTLGEYNRKNYNHFLFVTLKKYFAQYWVAMFVNQKYASYDLFGYLTNIEFSCYFTRVSVEKKSYEVWQNTLNYNLVHIVEDPSFEALNYDLRSSHIPSHAFALNQNMFLDDLAFQKAFLQNSDFINQYRFQMMSKDLPTYENKLTGKIPDDLDYIKRIWAIKYGNNLFNEMDNYNQRLDQLIAHEVAHIFDSRADLPALLLLPYPNTLHNIDKFYLTYQVNTEFNAFCSEIINARQSKATINTLISCYLSPTPSLGLGYPHAIGRNRLLHFMLDPSQNESEQILNFSRYFDESDELIKKIKYLKWIMIGEMGKKYYHRSTRYFLVQYVIFIIPALLILINYIIYKKYHI